jgi:hypothetical protein
LKGNSNLTISTIKNKVLGVIGNSEEQSVVMIAESVLILSCSEKHVKRSDWKYLNNESFQKVYGNRFNKKNDNEVTNLRVAANW